MNTKTTILRRIFFFSVMFKSVRFCGTNASVRYNFSVLFEFHFFFVSVRFCTTLKFDPNIFLVQFAFVSDGILTKTFFFIVQFEFDSDEI